MVFVKSYITGKKNSILVGKPTVIQPFGLTPYDPFPLKETYDFFLKLFF